MRRLNFRFQRILELKEQVEEVRRAALGEVVAGLELEKRSLEDLERTRRHYRLDGAAHGGLVDQGLLVLGSQFELRLAREIWEQTERVRQADLVVEERRGELLAATKERRVFEILRARAEEAHRHEGRRQERIWLDEVGQQLHMRKGSEAVERRNEQVESRVWQAS